MILSGIFLNIQPFLKHLLIIFTCNFYYEQQISFLSILLYLVLFFKTDTMQDLFSWEVRLELYHFLNLLLVSLIKDFLFLKLRYLNQLNAKIYLSFSSTQLLVLLYSNSYLFLMNLINFFQALFWEEKLISL